MGNVKPRERRRLVRDPGDRHGARQGLLRKAVQASCQDDDTGPNPMAIFRVADMKSGISGHLYPGKPAASGSGNTIHLLCAEPLEDSLNRVGEERRQGGLRYRDDSARPLRLLHRSRRQQHRPVHA